MDYFTKGLIAGVIFGLIAVAFMIPMDFGGRNKKIQALAAAFIERFSIGFVIPWISFPIPHLVTGLLIGILLSLPSAIITKTHIPILVIGAIGGAVIGYFT